MIQFYVEAELYRARTYSSKLNFEKVRVQKSKFNMTVEVGGLKPQIQKK